MVGSRLLQLARDRGARTISVVGTAKGVGKTTALLAICEAATRAELCIGYASAGFRARLPLRAGTVFATARTLLPATPATVILRAAGLETPVGSLVYAYTLHDGDYDVIGPSTAGGLREVAEFLSAHTEFVLVDGAVDRLAMLAGSESAVVVACGAAGAKSEAEAVDEVAALIERLRVPVADLHEETLDVATALTPSMVEELIRSRERRQIVVDDPTQIALHGSALKTAARRLRLRCRHPLTVVAATTCAIAPDRAFDPAQFVRAVARRTGLPAFDVFAGREAA